jgi:hypothetical protein
MNTSSLLVGILMTMIVATSITASLSNHVVYAHTFSGSENALFLTVIHQIEAETLLAEKNLSTNPELAQQHANTAIYLLNHKHPTKLNTTWAKEIAERNPRIAAELTSALNSLKNATSINQSKSSSTISMAANSANNIKAQVDRINGLLGEAVSSRVTKEQLNNSTTQALVLASLANEVFFSYGRALGEPPSAMSDMVGMAVSVKEASPSSSSTNMSSTTTTTTDMKNRANPDMGSSLAMTSRSNTIKNITEYQTTQALTDTVKEVFNKNLKPMTPSILKAANTEVENDLDQLKAAIDNKVAFMDIMKIIHIQLIPTLITAYNLKLESF